MLQLRFVVMSLVVCGLGLSLVVKELTSPLFFLYQIEVSNHYKSTLAENLLKVCDDGLAKCVMLVIDR